MQDAPNKPKEKLTRAHKIALAFISFACCALIGGSCFALTNPDVFSSSASSQTEQEANNEPAANENQSDSNNESSTENGNPSQTAENSTQSAAQNSSTPSSNNALNTSASNNQQATANSSSTPAQNNQSNTVTVSVSVSSSAADGRVSGSAHPTFSQGATVYDALCATGLSVSASQTTYGIYVSAIGGLAEKEFGGSSGWMYSVNGSVPQTACSNYILKDGDAVSWYYVV